MRRTLSLAEIAVIIVLALIPTFATFPYRINIFLSWEGAYRIAEGQIPYKDFGMPVGYMYWVIPAFFFKLFGAKLITLIKAQAFINILGGLAFRSILGSAEVRQPLRFAGVLLFCLSFSFLNYWPWYNHTVIIYELIGLAFLMQYFFPSYIRLRYVFVSLAGVFIFFSFFTKQDAGALGFLICVVLLAYDSVVRKQWMGITLFLLSFLLTAIAMTLPLPSTGMTYWFNHGQAPHSSRISISDILSEFLGASQWIKFYLAAIILLLWARINADKTLLRNHVFVIFSLLTLGILAEAAIFQVTSYVPQDNNIFFHSFAAVFLVWLLMPLLHLNVNNWKGAAFFAAAVMLWWSPVFWRYIERFVLRPDAVATNYIAHDGYKYATTVNKNTYMIELDTTDIPMDQWRVPSLQSFEKILLPGPTVDGIERLMSDTMFKNKSGLKVLNMTELTPLAKEMQFELERGPDYPLWFHKGVGMFEKETKMFVDRIESNHYDLVLFEYIPYLNNFYPYEVRDALKKHYKLKDRFPAPRKPASHAFIEVYVLNRQ